MKRKKIIFDTREALHVVALEVFVKRNRIDSVLYSEKETPDKNVNSFEFLHEDEHTYLELTSKLFIWLTGYNNYRFWYENYIKENPEAVNW